MKRSIKIFIPIYIAILVLSSFYIKSVLRESPLDKKSVKKIEEQPYAINVILKVINETNINTYNIQLKNNDTVKDLLEEVRDHNNFSYEITEYLHKNEIDIVNKIQTPQGYKWIIEIDGQDITNNLGNEYLKTDGIYELKLVTQ